MKTRNKAIWMFAGAIAATVVLAGTPVLRAESRGRDSRSHDRSSPRVVESRGPQRIVERNYVVHERYGPVRRDWDHGDRDRREVRVFDRDRFERRSDLGIRVVFGPSCVPVPASIWVPGHFVTQTTQVLVEPAHTETQYVQPVTETRYPSDGPAYTVVVQEGGYRQVLVPDRFETRTCDVWVPGHYEPAPPPVVYHDSGVHVSIGGIIRF